MEQDYTGATLKDACSYIEGKFRALRPERGPALQFLVTVAVEPAIRGQLKQMLAETYLDLNMYNMGI